MNYDVLSTELTTDPAERGYSAMTDAEAAASINTADIPGRQLVEIWQIKKALIESTKWLALKAAQASENQQLAGAAMLAVDYLSDTRFEHLDMDLTATQTMIGALVQGNVITQAEADEIDALADTLSSRADALGLGTVSADDVGLARGTRLLVQREVQQ